MFASRLRLSMVRDPSKFCTQNNNLLYCFLRKKPERKLEAEHIDFLLSEETLLLQAGFTMKERVEIFT
jgi:hypothetical protein